MTMGIGHCESAQVGGIISVCFPKQSGARHAVWITRTAIVFGLCDGSTGLELELDKMLGRAYGKHPETARSETHNA
jgi:hypothetical protein